MYSVKLAVLAENAFRDADRNGISLINIIENINSKSFPIVIPRIISLWILTREPQDPAIVEGFEVVISLGDLVQHQVPLEVNFLDQPSTRVILTLDGYMAPNPGMLTASLRLSGAEIGRYTIPILPAPSNQQATIQPS